MNFGEALKSRREEQGLTQQEIADRAGLSRAFISSIELDKTPPGSMSVEAIINLARALGLNPLQLLKRAKLITEEDLTNPFHELDERPDLVETRVESDLEGLSLKHQRLIKSLITSLKGVKSDFNQPTRRVRYRRKPKKAPTNDSPEEAGDDS